MRVMYTPKDGELNVTEVVDAFIDGLVVHFTPLVVADDFACQCSGYAQCESIVKNLYEYGKVNLDEYFDINVYVEEEEEEC